MTEDQILAGMARIEQKLDILIAALLDEEEAAPELTLDGAPAGGERDQAQSLG